MNTPEAQKPSLRGELLGALADLEAKGHDHVSIAGLRSYIKQFIEDEAEVRSIREAAEKRSHDLVLQTLTEGHSIRVELMKSANEAGNSALRSATLINGGAAVALLAYVGQSLPKAAADSRIDTSALASAMLIFFVGCGLASLAYAARYLTQHLISNTDTPKYGQAKFSNYVAIALGLASFVFFFAGGIAAYSAFG